MLMMNHSRMTNTIVPKGIAPAELTEITKKFKRSVQEKIILTKTLLAPKHYNLERHNMTYMGRAMELKIAFLRQDIPPAVIYNLVVT